MPNNAKKLPHPEVAATKVLHMHLAQIKGLIICTTVLTHLVRHAGTEDRAARELEQSGFGSGRAQRRTYKAYIGRVKVGKLNVDDNLALTSQFKIRGVPTLLLFKGGQVRDQIAGAASKEAISKLLDNYL